MKKKNSKFSIEAIFASRRFTIVLSLLLAIVLWLYVINVVETEASERINVQVNFDYNDVYSDLGLDIIEKPVVNVSVSVQGENRVVGGLTSQDIIVYPDYSSVTGAGEYKLSLVARKLNSLDDFNIIGLSVDTVSVTFDKVSTQTFSIAVNATGIRPADGYYLDVSKAAPSEVTLSGPEADIARVARVVANVSLTEERSESALVTVPLTYLDENGEVITDANITADVSQVDVTIPILKMKSVPLTIDFTGVPAGFDPEQLKPTLSESTVLIAGAASQVDQIESISAGIIDLTTFELGETVDLTIELPDGVKFVEDGVDHVTVSFDTTGYTTRTMTVTEFVIINQPSNMELTIPNARLANVQLIGPEEELEELAPTSVVAQIDASSDNISVVRGQQNVPVRIVIPSSGSIFATGSYGILCNITLDEAAASSASEAG